MTLIRELDNYKLVVGDSVEREGSLAYQVVNKEFNVIETETFILPQAHDYLEQLQAALDAQSDAADAMIEEAGAVKIASAKYNH